MKLCEINDVLNPHVIILWFLLKTFIKILHNLIKWLIEWVMIVNSKLCIVYEFDFHLFKVEQRKVQPFKVDGVF